MYSSCVWSSRVSGPAFDQAVSDEAQSDRCMTKVKAAIICFNNSALLGLPRQEQQKKRNVHG